jgi:hypothetical protein
MSNQPTTFPMVCWFMRDCCNNGSAREDATVDGARDELGPQLDFGTRWLGVTVGWSGPLLAATNAYVGPFLSSSSARLASFASAMRGMCPEDRL